MTEISNAEKLLIKRYNQFLLFISITILLLLIPFFLSFYSPGIYKIILALMVFGLTYTYITKNRRLLAYVRNLCEKRNISFPMLYIGYIILYALIIGVIVFFL
ncbi:Uncharacterised protein [Mycobacteroides abscessus subsp. abscessus]|nr:Uncharacterised protein [Mycobacteroides abscessus subsp. abscessus]